MSFPIFRTSPTASRRITWWACALGYLITLVGVPLLAGAVMQIAIFTLKGTGITRTFIGPALQFGELMVTLLTYSIIASYIGAIVSIPVVIWARWKGWFGWGTAALTGVGVGGLVLSIGFSMQQELGRFVLPCAILGLAFWITVRLIHPSAVRRR